MSGVRTPPAGESGNKRRRVASEAGSSVSDDDDCEPNQSALLPGNIVQALDELQLTYDEKILRSAAAQAKAKMLEAEQRGLPPLVHRMSLSGWTEVAESQALRDFENHRAQWSLPEGSFDFHVRLWKTCANVANCSPRDIVGARNRLCFLYDTRTPTKSDEFTPWTRHFCEKLDMLVPHPAWVTGQPGGKVESLVFAIRYAVILRTNDPRPLLYNGRDPLLRRIKELVASGRSKRNAHAKARRELLATGVYMPFACMSNVLLALETAIQSPTEVATVDPHASYGVSSEDLQHVIDALDSMRDSDTGNVLMSTSLYSQTSMAIRPYRSPPSTKQFPGLYAEEMREEMRRILYNRLVAEDQLCPRQGSLSPTGGPLDDTDSYSSPRRVSESPLGDLPDVGTSMQPELHVDPLLRVELPTAGPNEAAAPVVTASIVNPMASSEASDPLPPGCAESDRLPPGWTRRRGSDPPEWLISRDSDPPESTWSEYPQYFTWGSFGPTDRANEEVANIWRPT